METELAIGSGLTEMPQHRVYIEPFAGRGTIMQGLVLSIFPGADLLGRGFEAEGFCVVRGPDLLWGGDAKDFHPAPNVFCGVIGGSPCQDFSRQRRTPRTGNGEAMLSQYLRMVTEAGPVWFLHENVCGCPDLTPPPGYKVQRFYLNARECGCCQNRPRKFQFCYREGGPLVIPRAFNVQGLSQPCALATEGKRAERRTFADFCALQGLPRDFDLPGLSLAAKYRAVGNGVPVPMARVLAVAVLRRTVTNFEVRLCVCECGREVPHGRTLATAACRKRVQRRRDAAGLRVTGPVTPCLDASLAL